MRRISELITAPEVKEVALGLLGYFAIGVVVAPFWVYVVIPAIDAIEHFFGFGH